MTLRRILPVSIGIGVFLILAIIVAVLLSRAKDDEYFVVKAATRIVGARYDAERLQAGQDYRIESVKVFSRDERFAVVKVMVLRPDGPAPVYLELTRQGGDWAQNRDLQEHFTSFVKSDAVQAEMGRRFEAAVADRYKAAIEINGPSFRFLLSDPETDVLATTDFRFAAGTMQGRYVETYRYRGREWMVDGQGRVFEGVGR